MPMALRWVASGGRARSCGFGPIPNGPPWGRRHVQQVSCPHGQDPGGLRANRMAVCGFDVHVLDEQREDGRLYHPANWGQSLNPEEFPPARASAGSPGRLRVTATRELRPAFGLDRRIALEQQQAVVERVRDLGLCVFRFTRGAK